MITHTTPGAAPIPALTLLGVSAKDCASPIGRFGSGFKFAVATLLRHGASIWIEHPDLGHLEFASEHICIRGEHFYRVTLAGEPLGFTTGLGPDWTPKHAFRELHSNTLDEGGTTAAPERLSPPPPNTTRIVVSGCPAYSAAFAARDELFLSTPPLYTGSYMALHPGPSPIIYYRGVAVFTAPCTFPHTVNILWEVRLTEDRTLPSPWYYEFSIACDMPHFPTEILAHWLNLPQGVGVNLYPASPSGEFLRLAMEAYRAGRALSTSLRSKCAALERETALAARSEAAQPDHHRAVDDCCALLASRGINLPQVYIVPLDPGIRGRCEAGRILLSPALFQEPRAELLKTLFEEYLHLTTGAGDFTREFQEALLEGWFQQLVFDEENTQ